MNKFGTNSNTNESKSHVQKMKTGADLQNLVSDILGGKASTAADFSGTGQKQQKIANLPAELLSQPRFLPVNENKHPKLKEWQKPENQKPAAQIRGLKGFDINGHGTVDYLLIDFDHVLNDAGEFLYPEAEKWLNYILQSDDNVFCERSISGHGLHILLAPTSGKFATCTGNIIFDKAKGAKIELFYLNAARYCLLTGNLFRCQPNALIPHGEVADEIFQHLLNEIAKNQPTNKSTEKTTRQSPSKHEDTPDYDSFRADIMLNAINPAELEDSKWLAVNSACKNIGIDYSVVDAFNRRDPDRYNETGNKARWDSATDPSFNIRTLHGIAQRFGYREADARRQWYELHPELRPSKRLRSIAEDTRRELDDAVIWLETLSAEDFSADDAYNPDNIHAVALAQTYGFAAASEKFFSVIKTAKAQAQIRLKEAESEFTASPDIDELAELSALANLHLETLRKNVTREVQALARAQKDFAKQQAEEETKQKAIKAKSERQSQIEENIKTLIELRAEYKKNPSPELANKIRTIIFNSCDVTTDRYTGEVKQVKATAANANLFFTFDPYLDGTIGFDEFQQADVILKRPPWRHNDDCINAEWTDRDDAQLRLYLREHYIEFANKNLVDDLTTSYSDKHSFHPVKDYFRNLPKWDGIPRAEKIFIDFLGVADTSFAREVTLNWLRAAVARIFHPGCEYQIAPILHGNQGIGKGFILKRLGGEWYGAISENVDDSHAVDSIQNIWLGEFKEMKGLRKADVNAIKSFIDTAIDDRRPPYGRRAKKFGRHCVFAITVNDDQFLSDTTGNRRFPVLECTLPLGQYIKGLTNEYISQIWAEVYQQYCELRDSHSELTEKEFVKILEEYLELSAETKNQVENVAKKFMRDDGLTGEIEAFVNTKIPPAVIWNLLSKEERRKFFANGGNLPIYGGKDELITRRKARGGRNKNVDADIKKIEELLSPQNERKLYRKIDSTIIIYGSEYRQHICAAEIFNECFDNDKRKSMIRIHEILATLTQWKPGKMLSSYNSCYGMQRKVFYRTVQPEEPNDNDNDNDNTPDKPADNSKENSAPAINGQTTPSCNEPRQNSYDDFLGEPIDPTDLPPFLD